MSVSYIPDTVKMRLWGKAGGRCEYDGCNEPLWVDTLTQGEFNTAYIAHIVADKAGGERGDSLLSDQLKSELSNLMLLCDQHHRLIDIGDVAGHPVERLRWMKELHERRIEMLTALGPEKRSLILLYGANIGDNNAQLFMTTAADAMLPERYPAESRPIALGMTNSALKDTNPSFWLVEAAQMRARFEQQVRPRLTEGGAHHLSIFAIAPQPLLMLLGHMLCDIPATEVYQLHREPPDWRWQPDPDGFEYQIAEPNNANAPPALVFSLSATINDERVHAVVPGASVWKVSIQAPNNDFLKGRGQLRLFREKVRLLLDRIKAAHGEQAMLHVFPAMPVALAFDFGRIVMPKADLKMQIYDQNQTLGGFVRALDLP
jgi:hypothetical protein